MYNQFSSAQQDCISLESLDTVVLKAPRMSLTARQSEKLGPQIAQRFQFSKVEDRLLLFCIKAKCNCYYGGGGNVKKTFWLKKVLHLKNTIQSRVHWSLSLFHILPDYKTSEPGLIMSCVLLSPDEVAWPTSSLSEGTACTSCFVNSFSRCMVQKQHKDRYLMEQQKPSWKMFSQEKIRSFSLMEWLMLGRHSHF